MNKKKVLALVTATVMAASAMGCGASSDTAETPADNTESTDSTEAAKDTQETGSGESAATGELSYTTLSLDDNKDLLGVTAEINV